MTPTSPTHVRKKRPRQPHAADHVEPVGVIPVLVGELIQRQVTALTAAVVDQDVGASEPAAAFPIATVVLSSVASPTTARTESSPGRGVPCRISSTARWSSSAPLSECPAGSGHDGDFAGQAELHEVIVQLAQATFVPYGIVNLLFLMAAQNQHLFICAFPAVKVSGGTIPPRVVVCRV
jgi:hypothetical protein